MVKARYYTFTSMSVLAANLGFIFLILQCPLHYLGIDILKNYANDNKGNLYLLFFGLAGFAFLYFVFLTKMKILRVDETDQSVTIKNIVTGRGKVYKFSELDGYSDTVRRYGRGNGTPYKGIEIIKDKNVLLTVDGAFYSNVDEIKSSLSQLQYLGIDIDWTKDSDGITE